jgi:hypothetical protein
MRSIANTRIAALAAALVTGALAAYALRPGSAVTGPTARVQPQAVEVRTQVIRRTVHIVRHERPPRPRATHGASAAGSTATALARVGTAPRTGTSGSHAALAGTPAAATAPRTRTSGSTTAVAPSSGSSAPVRTRTSGGSTGGGSGTTAVRTRTSGGGEGSDNGKGHDD